MDIYVAKGKCVGVDPVAACLSNGEGQGKYVMVGINRANGNVVHRQLFDVHEKSALESHLSSYRGANNVFLDGRKENGLLPDIQVPDAETYNDWSAFMKQKSKHEMMTLTNMSTVLDKIVITKPRTMEDVRSNRTRLQGYRGEQTGDQMSFVYKEDRLFGQTKIGMRDAGGLVVEKAYLEPKTKEANAILTSVYRGTRVVSRLAGTGTSVRVLNTIMDSFVPQRDKSRNVVEHVGYRSDDVGSRIEDDSFLRVGCSFRFGGRQYDNYNVFRSAYDIQFEKLEGVLQNESGDAEGLGLCMECMFIEHLLRSCVLQDNRDIEVLMDKSDVFTQMKALFNKTKGRRPETIHSYFLACVHCVGSIVLESSGIALMQSLPFIIDQLHHVHFCIKYIDVRRIVSQTFDAPPKDAVERIAQLRRHSKAFSDEVVKLSVGDETKVLSLFHKIYRLWSQTTMMWSKPGQLMDAQLKRLSYEDETWKIILARETLVEEVNDDAPVDNQARIRPPNKIRQLIDFVSPQRKRPDRSPNSTDPSGTPPTVDQPPPGSPAAAEQPVQFEQQPRRDKSADSPPQTPRADDQPPPGSPPGQQPEAGGPQREFGKGQRLADFFGPELFKRRKQRMAGIGEDAYLGSLPTWYRFPDPPSGQQQEAGRRQGGFDQGQRIADVFTSKSSSMRREGKKVPVTLPGHSPDTQSFMYEQSQALRRRKPGPPQAAQPSSNPFDPPRFRAVKQPISLLEVFYGDKLLAEQMSPYVILLASYPGDDEAVTQYEPFCSDKDSALRKLKAAKLDDPSLNGEITRGHDNYRNLLAANFKTSVKSFPTFLMYDLRFDWDEQEWASFAKEEDVHPVCKELCTLEQRLVTLFSGDTTYEQKTYTTPGMYIGELEEELRDAFRLELNDDKAESNYNIYLFLNCLLGGALVKVDQILDHLFTPSQKDILIRLHTDGDQKALDVAWETTPGKLISKTKYKRKSDGSVQNDKPKSKYSLLSEKLAKNERIDFILAELMIHDKVPLKSYQEYFDNYLSREYSLLMKNVPMFMTDSQASEVNIDTAFLDTFKHVNSTLSALESTVKKIGSAVEENERVNSLEISQIYEKGSALVAEHLQQVPKNINFIWTKTPHPDNYTIQFPRYESFLVLLPPKEQNTGVSSFSSFVNRNALKPLEEFSNIVFLLLAEEWDPALPQETSEFYGLLKDPMRKTMKTAVHKILRSNLRVTYGRLEELSRLPEPFSDILEEEEKVLVGSNQNLSPILKKFPLLEKNQLVELNKVDFDNFTLIPLLISYLETFNRVTKSTVESGDLADWYKDLFQGPEVNEEDTKAHDSKTRTIHETLERALEEKKDHLLGSQKLLEEHTLDEKAKERRDSVIERIQEESWLPLDTPVEDEIKRNMYAFPPFEKAISIQACLAILCPETPLYLLNILDVFSTSKQTHLLAAKIARYMLIEYGGLLTRRQIEQCDKYKLMDAANGVNDNFLCEACIRLLFGSPAGLTIGFSESRQPIHEFTGSLKPNTFARMAAEDELNSRRSAYRYYAAAFFLSEKTLHMESAARVRKIIFHTKEASLTWSFLLEWCQTEEERDRILAAISSLDFPEDTSLEKAAEKKMLAQAIENARDIDLTFKSVDVEAQNTHKSHVETWRSHGEKAAHTLLRTVRSLKPLQPDQRKGHEGSLPEALKDSVEYLRSFEVEDEWRSEIEDAIEQGKGLLLEMEAYELDKRLSVTPDTLNEILQNSSLTNRALVFHFQKLVIREDGMALFDLAGRLPEKFAFARSHIKMLSEQDLTQPFDSPMIIPLTSTTGITWGVVTIGRRRYICSVVPEGRGVSFHAAPTSDSEDQALPEPHQTTIKTLINERLKSAAHFHDQGMTYHNANKYDLAYMSFFAASCEMKDMETHMRAALSASKCACYPLALYHLEAARNIQRADLNPSSKIHSVVNISGKKFEAAWEEGANQVAMHHFSQALENMDTEDSENTIEELRNSHDHCNLFTECTFLLGILYSIAGDTEMARVFLKKALKFASPSYKKLIEEHLPPGASDAPEVQVENALQIGHESLSKGLNATAYILYQLSLGHRENEEVVVQNAASAAQNLNFHFLAALLLMKHFKFNVGFYAEQKVKIQTLASQTLGIVKAFKGTNTACKFALDAYKLNTSPSKQYAYHLGDALHQAGRTEEAIPYMLEARQRDNDLDPTQLHTLEKLLSSAEYKRLTQHPQSEGENDMTHRSPVRRTPGPPSAASGEPILSSPIRRRGRDTDDMTHPSPPRRTPGPPSAASGVPISSYPIRRRGRDTDDMTHRSPVRRTPGPPSAASGVPISSSPIRREERDTRTVDHGAYSASTKAFSDLRNRAERAGLNLSQQRALNAEYLKAQRKELSYPSQSRSKAIKDLALNKLGFNPKETFDIRIESFGQFIKEANEIIRRLPMNERREVQILAKEHEDTRKALIKSELQKHVPASTNLSSFLLGPLGGNSKINNPEEYVRIILRAHEHGNISIIPHVKNVLQFSKAPAPRQTLIQRFDKDFIDKIQNHIDTRERLPLPEEPRRWEKSEMTFFVDYTDDGFPGGNTVEQRGRATDDFESPALSQAPIRRMHPVDRGEKIRPPSPLRTPHEMPPLDLGTRASVRKGRNNSEDGPQGSRTREKPPLDGAIASAQVNTDEAAGFQSPFLRDGLRQDSEDGTPGSGRTQRRVKISTPAASHLPFLGGGTRQDSEDGTPGSRHEDMRMPRNTMRNQGRARAAYTRRLVGRIQNPKQESGERADMGGGTGIGQNDSALPSSLCPDCQVSGSNSAPPSRPSVQLNDPPPRSDSRSQRDLLLQ